jgi:hypothetical protein
MNTKRLILAWSICLTASYAHAFDYDKVKSGKLEGKIVVQWLKPDLFLFIPDAQNPLTFTRSTGETIRPGRMITDGGSIPRPLWAFRSYSPWGYAPAFIVHDWLFHMKHCQVGDYTRYDVTKAADVLAEVIKTMMESGKVEKDRTTVTLMHTAVSSIFARRLWDDGACVPAPAAFDQPPLAEYTIKFP